MNWSADDGGRGAARCGDGDIDGAGAGRVGGGDLGAGRPTVKLVAAVVPKFTAVAPVKPVPVTATVVPPDRSPLDGDTAVTTGGAGGAGVVV